MRPPIASPHENSEPLRPIVKRIEWDEERDCFTFRYASPLRGRLRCEIYTGLRNPSGFLGVTLFLPLTAALLALTNLAQKAGRPNEFRVFAWGIEDAATEMTLRCEWKNVKRALTHRGDLFVWRRSFLVAAYYLCRETFVDEAESQRFQQIITLLKSQNGANWEAVKSRFKI